MVSWPIQLSRLSINLCSRTDDYDLLASEIQDKTADDVADYYPVFKKKWKELSGMGEVSYLFLSSS